MLARRRQRLGSVFIVQETCSGDRYVDLLKIAVTNTTVSDLELLTVLCDHTCLSYIHTARQDRDGMKIKNKEKSLTQ